MENKIIYPSFIQIPFKVIVDKKLEPLDRMVYGLILWYYGLTLRKCIASNVVMAQLLKTKNRRCISNSLTRLEKQKHIKRIYKDIAKKMREEIIPLTPLDDGRLKTDWDEVVGFARDNYKLEVSEFWLEKERKSDLYKEIMEGWKKQQSE